MSTAISPASARTFPSCFSLAEEILHNGDHLSSDEFLRRYERMPDVKKAELVEGIVYLASPVRAHQHGIPDSLIQMWLGNYAALHPTIFVASNTTVEFDLDDVFQPDAVLCVEPEHGGGVRFDERGYLIGRPELVVEVAASSASLDLHVKRRVYRRHGVPEYLVWRTVERVVEWFFLEEGEYRPQTPDADGILASRIFPGLRLPVEALLAGDRRALIDAVK